MSNYADLPWGFSLIVAHPQRRTTQHLPPTPHDFPNSLCKSVNPSVSCADSSLYTREPLSVSSKGTILQNLEPPLM